MKNNSLTRRMWVMMVVIVLSISLAFIIGILAVKNISDTDYKISTVNTRINAIKGTIESDIQSYKDLSRLVMVNGLVTDFLRTKDVNAGMINDTHFEILDILNVCNNVDSVFIFRNDGEYVSTGKGIYYVDFERMKTEEWLKPITDRRGGAVLSINADSAIRKKNGPVVVTIEREIYDINSQKRTGLLLMNISAKMLSRVVSEQGSKTILITDDDGQYLAGNKELMTYYRDSFKEDKITYIKTREGFKRKIVGAIKIEDMPLNVICINEANGTTIPYQMFIIMGLLFVCFIAAILLANVFVTKNVTEPIITLSESIKSTKQSGYLEQIDVNMPNNELKELADSYNSMIEHIAKLIDSLLEKEKAEQRAEMMVLNEQIKPHFLYNSLETISYLAIEEKADGVHDAIESLGSFYRNFLSKGDREISLRREIAIIKDYLTLQKLRYGEIISDEYDIDPETEKCILPKLTLQPLVENCIYHGIRPKGEEGIIKISSRHLGDSFTVSVYDSGVGMDENIIERILAGEDVSEKKDDYSKRSFGLLGTIERIRYYCGNNDAISIQSEEGEYTIITIEFPIKLSNGTSSY